MNFSNPIFIILFSTGFLFIIAGYFLKNKPPKTINYFYGYRTKSSMMNQERWNFAQLYSGKKLIISGFLLCALGVFALLINIDKSILTIMLCIILILIGCVIPVALTERALRQTFNK